jgi:hypothetical protein
MFTIIYMEPVFMGPVLSTFLTSEAYKFGVINPKSIINTFKTGELIPMDLLIDKCPLLKNGYALQDSIYILLNIYISINLKLVWGNRYLYGDYYMNSIFGGQIPALYYLRKMALGNEKIFMDQAVQRGYIKQPINSYQVVNNINLSFHTIQNLIAYNIMPITNNNPQLIYEHELIRQVWEQLQAISEDDMILYQEYLEPPIIKQCDY